MKKRFDFSFYMNALRLALPIAVQNLLTSSATLIDTAMVAGIGDAAVSAIGGAVRYGFLLNVICFGIASGCSSLISQYWGGKEMKNLRRTYGFALTIGAVIALIFTVLLSAFPFALMRVFTDKDSIAILGAEYIRIYAISVPFIVFSQITCFVFRAVEQVLIPLLSSIASVSVNIFFNYCFIAGNLGFPALGLRGAAVASVIGSVTQALLLLVFLLFFENPFRRGFWSGFRFDRVFCRNYIRIAAPVLANESFWALGTNVYIMVIGRQGIQNHAGYTLFENIQQLCFVFFVGICGACSIMVGKAVGAGDHERAKQTALRFEIMTPLCGLLVGTALFFCCRPLLSLFSVESEQARETAIACLRFYALWLPIRMIPYNLICGVFRAAGDTLTGCLLELTGLYAFGIPAVLITGLLFRPKNFLVIVIVMFMAEDLFKAVCTLWHFSRGKWIRQITEKKPSETVDGNTGICYNLPEKGDKE